MQRVNHLEINSQFSIDLFDNLIILGQKNPIAKIRMIMRFQDEKFEESWYKYGQKFTTNNWNAIISFGGDTQFRLENNLNTEFISQWNSWNPQFDNWNHFNFNSTKLILDQILSYFT